MVVSNTAPRRLSIFGSTGSIGQQTIDLVERNPDRYRVAVLTANSNVDVVAQQARKLKPELVVIADPARFTELKQALSGTGIELAAGKDALEQAATIPTDLIMAGIVGYAGLPPTLAAARRGAVIAFANKETLVCAGPLMMDLVKQHKATLIPVDSEHNAIWQVFDFKRKNAMRRLILTASGGPFRTFTTEQMARVTPQQAVKHPVWAMGAKISIDSATMMNKGLEVIEASHLFDMPSEKIDVLIHPQSVVHSMVEYTDGSVLNQMGTPDMRTPIGYALAWPDRMETPAARLDLTTGPLTFENPDPVRFPALRLAREALATGGTAPAILNAANEVAVQAFLDDQIGFLDICAINEATLGQVQASKLTSLEVLAEADQSARRHASAMAKKAAA